MPSYISEINGRAFRKGSFSAGLTLSQSGIDVSLGFAIIVVADNFDTTFLEIMEVPGVPQFFDSFSTAFVNDIQFERAITKHRDTGNDTYAWTLNYSLDSNIDLNNVPRNSDGTINGSGQAGNPLFLPADFDVDAEIEYVPTDRIEKDANGTPFVNRFGENLSSVVEGLETERVVNVIRIQRWGNWPTPIAQLNFYNNTVNQFAFFDVPVGCAWMTVKSKKAWYNGEEYARESYVIRVLIDPSDPTAENTWGEITVPHKSNFFLAQSNNENSRRSRSPRGGWGPFLLAADGRIAQTAADVQMLTFAPKRSADWGPLNLPNR